MQNANQKRDRIARAADALQMKCLPVPGEKLSIVLTCVAALMVPILRSS